MPYKLELIDLRIWLSFSKTLGQISKSDQHDSRFCIIFLFQDPSQPPPYSYDMVAPTTSKCPGQRLRLRLRWDENMDMCRSSLDHNLTSFCGPLAWPRPPTLPASPSHSSSPLYMSSAFHVAPDHLFVRPLRILWLCSWKSDCPNRAYT